MKQKFNVTGMTCKPHDICDAAGTPFSFTCAGGVNPPLRQGFAPRGKTLVRATRRVDEQFMPEVAAL